jgi:hypothetical protein
MVGNQQPKKRARTALAIGFAINVIENGTRTIVGHGRQPLTTVGSGNYLAELIAFKHALTHAVYISNQHESIVIHTDCTSMIDTLNNILQREAYGAANPYADVICGDIWKKVVALYKAVKSCVSIVWIESHMTGNRLHRHHSEVDRVANRTARCSGFHLNKEYNPTLLQLAF